MISSTYLRVLPAGTARPCRLTTWRGAQPGGHRPSVRAASEPLCLPCSGAQDGGGLDHPSRRQAALGAAAALVWLLSLRQQPAWAESELPQAYQDVVHKLVNVLQEAITKDLTGAEEREVRKAADPAQDLVRQVLTRWEGQAAVQQHESYRQLTTGIRELGEFYRQSGARARMSEEVGNSILTKLAAAEEALPPPPQP